ncbi:MAG TPA: Mur ligase family protein, partial [Anaerolineales bacterium]
MDGSRVVVLGLARQGKALARYLSERGARVVVSDMKPEVELTAEMAELEDTSVEFILGGHPPELLEGADLLCLSGGVPADLPLARQARLQGIRLTNDSQLFLEASPAPAIGITGSAGKTTTTELVGRMARAAAKGTDRSVWVGGNIGRPLISDLDRIQPRDFVVMELSSFQLELMTVSPPLAAVLNLTPNHLDRHANMQAYTAAKSSILAHQSDADVAVLGREDPGAWALRDQVRGRLISFGVRPSQEPGTFVEEGEVGLLLEGAAHSLFPLEVIALRGSHNVLNVLAACAIAA